MTVGAAVLATPLTRDVLGRCRLGQVKTTYTNSTTTIGSGKRAGELIAKKRRG
jgi:hypothetical protein